MHLPLVRDASGVVVGAREDRRELLVRTNGTSNPSFTPDGKLVFHGQDVFHELYTYNDLFELPRGVTSPSGMDGRRTRLTYGWRAIDPDVSPDGRRVVFTTNHRGTTYLQIADLRDGAIANVHALVPSERFDQAFTPRWSPDGRHVAYSSWHHGGLRDIRIVDASTGAFVEITHDRAIDGDPSFSQDGRWLFFHSDRTGVSNIYAYELATGKLHQVTNVINGRVPARRCRPTARRSSTSATRTSAGTCTRSPSTRRASSRRSPTSTIARRRCPTRRTATGGRRATTRGTR